MGGWSLSEIVTVAVFGVPSRIGRVFSDGIASVTVKYSSPSTAVSSEIVISAVRDDCPAPNMMSKPAWPVEVW